MIVDGVKYRCKDGGQDWFIPAPYSSEEELQKQKEDFARRCLKANPEQYEIVND